MKNVNNKYHYKAANLIALDELEYMMFESVNDYGYNLGSERRQIRDIEKMLTNPKRNSNKDFFNNYK